MNFDWCRHRWTGRYEAHLWDNSCRREGQARKGRQGIYFFFSIYLISSLLQTYNLSWRQELQSRVVILVLHICRLGICCFGCESLVFFPLVPKWDLEGLRRVSYRISLSMKLNARFKRSFTFFLLFYWSVYIFIMMIDWNFGWLHLLRVAKVFNFDNTFESELRDKKEGYEI